MSLILLKGLPHDFLKSYRLGSNGMHERSSLNPGKDIAVQNLSPSLLGKDQPPSRTTQGLMGG